MGPLNSGAVLGIVALVAASCAPTVVQEPIQLTPLAGPGFRLTRSVRVPLSTGYSTTLRADTRWQSVGTVAQGEVYRTRDQVVTIEGAHTHEAYIVVKDRALVGFYLPVERTFSPVSPAQSLAIEP